MNPPRITLEDVKRLRLDEGDTLVLRLLDRHPAPELITHLSAAMRDAFPDHKTVVLTAGAELEVVEGKSA
jgi:hypothetical protein